MEDKKLQAALEACSNCSRSRKMEKEEVEYIEKEEILNSIREGLREIKEARRTGRKLMTAEELLNEL